MMNTIRLLNGNTLPVYTSLEKENEEEELNTFLENAFYFYENRELIYQDSRLFLAKIPISYGMNEKNVCTLGGFLELWDFDKRSIVYNSKGERLLIFYTVGNPMTGSNTTRAVDSNGQVHCVKIEGRFIDMLKAISRMQSRYQKMAEEALPYSIKEVKELLMTKKIKIEHSDDKLTRLIKELQIRELQIKDYQNRELKEAKKTINALLKRLRKTRLLWKQTELLNYYKEADTITTEMNKELDILRAKKRAIKLRYPKDARGKEFQKEYMKVCKEMKEVKNNYNMQDFDKKCLAWPFNYDRAIKKNSPFPTQEELSETLKEEELRDSELPIYS